jgi:hypothetical protein
LDGTLDPRRGRGLNLHQLLALDVPRQDEDGKSDLLSPDINNPTVLDRKQMSISG